MSSFKGMKLHIISHNDELGGWLERWSTVIPTTGDTVLLCDSLDELFPEINLGSEFELVIGPASDDDDVVIEVHHHEEASDHGRFTRGWNWDVVRHPSKSLVHWNIDHGSGCFGAGQDKVLDELFPGRETQRLALSVVK